MGMLKNLRYHDTIKSDFKKLSSKECKEYMDYLLSLRIPLEKYYFEKLNGVQKETYIGDRIKSLDWVQDYEFSFMSSKQKEMYIFRKRYLSNDEFMKLDNSIKSFYIQMAVYTKIRLNDNEFSRLNDNLKKEYANFAFEFPQEVSIKMSKFLTKKNQKKYIEKQMQRGVSLTSEEISDLSDFSKKYYYKLKNINEIRLLVQNVLNE
tara:strand:- start:642 stop:1259 length:618 start_codon:yes stop_codon:yes gene_type:complete